jgi:hypothetical protein
LVNAQTLNASARKCSVPNVAQVLKGIGKVSVDIATGFPATVIGQHYTGLNINGQLYTWLNVTRQISTELSPGRLIRD